MVLIQKMEIEKTITIYSKDDIRRTRASERSGKILISRQGR